VIPRFYVGVLFHEIPKDDFYMGAVAKENFVRIRADHFARHQVGDNKDSGFGADQWMEKIEKAITPFIRDRGFDWEIHYLARRRASCGVFRALRRRRPIRKRNGCGLRRIALRLLRIKH
jgi:Putative oxalocrotonate tautomerase enzyme